MKALCADFAKKRRDWIYDPVVSIAINRQ